jgi:hypothetical protein
MASISAVLPIMLCFSIRSFKTCGDGHHGPCVQRVRDPAALLPRSSLHRGAEPIGQRVQFTGKNAGVCDRAVTRKVNSGFVPIRLILFNYSKNVMSFDKVSPGKNVPDAFNVVIEIPMNADPIKYEVDKESGAIFVDRFMTTAMHYPPTTATCRRPCRATATRSTCW